MKPTTMLYRNLLAMEAEEIAARESRRRRGAARRLRQDRARAGHGRDQHEPAGDLRARRADAARQLARPDARAAAATSGNTGRSSAPGTLDECAWSEMEDGIARSFGTCMTMGTASTMAAAAEALGPDAARRARRSPPPTRPIPRMATAAGRRIVEMVWEDLKPRDDPDHGGVRERGHDGDGARRLDQRHHPPDRDGRPRGRARSTSTASTRCRARTPFLANIRPSGKFLMEDFYYAGGLRGADAAA